MWQKWVNNIGDSLVGLNMIMNPQKFSLSNAKCNFQKSHMSTEKGNINTKLIVLEKAHISTT